MNCPTPNPEAPVWEGNQFRLNFMPTHDCYVYVLNVGPAGDVSMLFPNSRIRQGHFCHGGVMYEVPDDDNWFRFDGETGTETIHVIGSLDPLDSLASILDQAREAGGITNAQQELAEELRSIEQANAPQADGIVRTRSGVTIRGIDVQPDQRRVSAVLESGRKIEEDMDVLQGRATVVRQIRFRHVAAPP